jgi:two-component system, LytTR family, response regulator
METKPYVELPTSLGSEIKRPHVENKKFIQLPNNKGLELVPVEDIVFLSSDDKYIDIYFDNEQSKTIRCSMGRADRALGYPSFVRNHNRYIVNLDKIKQINLKDLTILLVNDMKIPISHRYKKGLLEKLKSRCCILHGQNRGGVII